MLKNIKKHLVRLFVTLVTNVNHIFFLFTNIGSIALEPTTKSISSFPYTPVVSQSISGQSLPVLPRLCSECGQNSANKGYSLCEECYKTS